MIPRWIVTRIKISRWILTRVMIPRWIVTPGLDSTLNCDPKLNCDLGLGSQFNVEFWPGVIIQRGILTQGHNSTWNSDPCIYLLPVELRLQKVSEFNSVIKIQQLRRVIIQRKIHWKLTPGRYSIGGSKFYLTPAMKHKKTVVNIFCIGKWKETGTCKSLHVPVSFHVPMQTKKSTSILNYSLTFQCSPNDNAKDTINTSGKIVLVIFLVINR